MKGNSMNLFLLSPVLKDILWGGDRLINEYGFSAEGLSRIAEAWVLSARPDGDNVIQNGEWKGKTLSQLISSCGKELLGTAAASEDFPLLIKLIDAKSDLSVQVHPDDAYARAHENAPGKTEAWYILDCDDGAELIYGFNRKISKELFSSSIADNSFLEYVNKVKVHKGDIFYIPSGTLHAIGGGILILEVQQNCNTTYRVFDYNRLENGKPRQLHVEKALDVTNTDVPAAVPTPFSKKVGFSTETYLCKCDYFKMMSVDVRGTYELNVNEKSFVSVLVINGTGDIGSADERLSLKKGSSVFIPADAGKFTVSGELEILISTL